jgi:glycine cleavage system H protein
MYRCTRVLRDIARRYTPDHEWIIVKNGVGTVGITDYAQKALGDVVYIEVPDIGKDIEKKGNSLSLMN